MILGDRMYKNIKIEKLDDYGRGICFIDKKITFVEDAIDGEIIDLKIVRSKKKFNEAIVTDFKEKSKDRVEYSCPYYKKCGGCNIAHFTYEKQLEFKKNKVENIIRRYTPYKDFKITNIIGDNALYYRNKVTLHVKNNKLGFYKKESNELVEIDHCLLLNRNINFIIQKINTYLKNHKLDIKEIIIRCIDEEVLLIIQGNVKKDFLDFIGNSNIVVNGKTVKHHSYIEDQLLGNTFLIKEKAFYQVNKKQVEKLYGLVTSLVKENEYKNVLDLYCGTGTIGISISPYVERVIGIELNHSSIVSAEENKKRNHIENIDFIEGKVEEKLEEVKGKFDLVIVDPPRSGLDRYAISVLKKINARSIIYISCDPMTLARDIALLNDQYELQTIDLVDMFKNTYHVENVSVLTLR